MMHEACTGPEAGLCAANKYTSQKYPLFMDAPWRTYAWIGVPWCAQT